MSIITKFLAVVTEPQFKLARDLTAMAIADGQVTFEEKEAMRTVCHLEGIDESRLLEALQDGYGQANEEMPHSHQAREDYLREIIRLIGADGYAAPQEIYLFQIIAGRMGLNQMNVIGLFLLTATHQYFSGDTGAHILATFLKNFIDPKGKTEMDNRKSLRTIFETVAANSETCQDAEANREILRQNLLRATEAFMENKILTKEFGDTGADFPTMLKQEAAWVLGKYGG